MVPVAPAPLEMSRAEEEDAPTSKRKLDDAHYSFAMRPCLRADGEHKPRDAVAAASRDEVRLPLTRAFVSG